MEDFFRKIVLSKGINDIWVELEIDVDKDFKPSEYNFGTLRISSIYLVNKEECNWDGMGFFFNATKKEIKLECKQELVAKELYVKGIFRTIRELIKEARKLGLYHEQGSK